MRATPARTLAALVVALALLWVIAFRHGVGIGRAIGTALFAP